MKKQYLYLLLALLMLSSTLTTSCKKQNMNDDYSDTQLQKSSVPYADSVELQQFTGDAQIVDYKLARKLALIQLYSSDRIKTQKWENYKLSQRPVVVYGFDNKPVFYDFFMCDASNVEKATVSVNAKKNASTIIKKFGNYVDNYATTKSYGQQLYADFAGVHYRGAATKSGNVNSAVNLSTGELVSNPESLSDDQIMLLMETELLPQMYQDPELLAHHLSAMKQRLADHKAKSEAMWNFISQNQTFVDTVSDAGISAMIFLPEGLDDEDNGGGGGTPGGSGNGDGTPPPPSNVGYSDDREQAYLISFDTQYKVKGRGGMCGPWIASYILKSAKGIDIPLSSFYQNAMVAENLNSELKYFSNGQISIDLSGCPEKEIYWNIRYDARCATRLTITGGLVWHWTCIYGATRDVFWNGNTNYYFLQADNGSLIRTPWNSAYRDPKDQYSYEALVWCDTKFSVNM